MRFSRINSGFIPDRDGKFRIIYREPNSNRVVLKSRRKIFSNLIQLSPRLIVEISTPPIDPPTVEISAPTNFPFGNFRLLLDQDGDGWRWTILRRGNIYRRSVETFPTRITAYESGAMVIDRLDKSPNLHDCPRP